VLTRAIADDLLRRLAPRFYRWWLRRAWLRLRGDEPTSDAREDVAGALRAFRPGDRTPPTLPAVRELLKRFDAGAPRGALRKQLGDLLRKVKEGPMPSDLRKPR
jgi:hypothetical protein